MNREEVLLQLKKRFFCRNHPEDKNAIVIDEISLKDFEKICSQFRCSGHYVEEHRVAVATNFGLYK